MDFSEYLIEVAMKNFERQSSHVFMLSDASEYTADEQHPSRFTKALCYGVFSYFSPEQAEFVLRNLGNRFYRLNRVFIGNLPDRDRADRFFRNPEDLETMLDVRDSPVGIWRSTAFMEALAARTGWRAEIRRMPENFYAAHYRFDVVLTRPGGGN